MGHGAIRLVRQWLVLSPLGRSLLQQQRQNRGIDDLLKAEQISGGITNILYRVTVTEPTQCDPYNVINNFDEQVLCFLRHGVGVRFFGCAKGDIVDRKREAATLDYLSGRGLCKRVFYRFEGGQIDEWRVGRSITTIEMRDPLISQSIAQQLAALHRIRLPPRNLSIDNSDDDEGDDASNDGSEPWRKIWKWLNILSQNKDISAMDILSPFDLSAIRQMATHLYEHNAQFKSPLVFCHNDLLSGNIVKIEEDCGGAVSCESQPRIEFIDFEYAGVGERGFDIANHFCEMAGFECNYDLLPNEEFQMEFLRIYLEALETETGEDETRIPASSEESSSDHSSSPSTPSTRPPPVCESMMEIKAILPEIGSYMLTAHLFWGLWALVQAMQWRGADNPPCDYLDYAHKRFAQLSPLLEQYSTSRTES